jgi:hypothetical protein
MHLSTRSIVWRLCIRFNISTTVLPLEVAIAKTDTAPVSERARIAPLTRRRIISSTTRQKTSVQLSTPQYASAKRLACLYIMTMLLWAFLSTLAIFRPSCVQSTTTTSDASVMPTASTPTPTSTLPTFEIDVIFPRENETYNFTSSLPIVFAFQNLTAAADLGLFRFVWDIMPYNSIEEPRPGGVLEDQWSIPLAANNVSMLSNDDGSPYILVNNTNPHDWVHGPDYGLGTAYALQWYVIWENLWNQCEHPAPGIRSSKILFTILPNGFPDEWAAPNPEMLGNVTENCAQLGSVGEVDRDKAVCDSFRQLDGASGNPCKIRGDDAMVSSISSVVGSLATAQSLATMTTSTASVASSTNAAVRTGVPVRPVYAAAAMFGGLQLLALR